MELAERVVDRRIRANRGFSLFMFALRRDGSGGEVGTGGLFVTGEGKLFWIRRFRRI